MFGNWVVAVWALVLGRAVHSASADITWQSFDDGLNLAKRHKRPMIVVIEKPWCLACQTLSKVFVESDDVQALSKQFIMTRLDSEETTGEIFQLDGKYYPRLFFLDHTGKILEDLQNWGGSSSTKYFYSSEREVAEVMRRALDLSQRGEL